MGNETSNIRSATDDVPGSNSHRRNRSNANTSNTPETSGWNLGSIAIAAGAAAAAVYVPERETKSIAIAAGAAAAAVYVPERETKELLDMGNETSNTRHPTHDGNRSNANRRNTSNASTSNTPRTNDWDVGSIVVAAGAAAVTVYGVSKLLSALTENTPEHETKTASETANSVWNLQQPRVYDYDDEEDTKQYPSRQINDSCDKEDYKCYPGRDRCDCRFEGRGLTKYQGKKQCFGAYKCIDCTNPYWESYFSFANTWQKCKVCRSKVYPYRQEPLESPRRLGEGIDKRKKHPQHLCGKCQELGYACFKNPYINL